MTDPKTYRCKQLVRAMRLGADNAGSISAWHRQVTGVGAPIHEDGTLGVKIGDIWSVMYTGEWLVEIDGEFLVFIDEMFREEYEAM